MPKYALDTKLIAFGKSLHAGQSGTLIQDLGNMLVLKADDQRYSKAYKPNGKTYKVFQVDSLLVRQLKD